MAAMKDDNLAAGVVYIAQGAMYWEEMCQSLASLARHDPSLPVTVFTDEKRGSVEAVHPRADIRILPADYLGTRVKPQILRDLCPFQRALYLDTDIHLCGSVAPLLAVLDYFDLAVAYTPFADEIPDAPPCFSIATEYNSGLFAIGRSPSTRSFLDRWIALYNERMALYESTGKQPMEYARRDQPSFTLALMQSDVRYFTLRPEWNLRLHSPAVVHGPVHVLHSRDRDFEAIAAELGKEPEAFRLWHPFSKDKIIPVWNPATKRSISVSPTRVGRWESLTSKVRGLARRLKGLLSR